jgi:hypothetical protein
MNGRITYWPHGRNKLPVLADFCVTNCIPQDVAVAKSCFDPSSDLSPVLITLTQPRETTKLKQQTYKLG